MWCTCHAAGEYTADRLKELQKNAVSINTAKLAPPPEQTAPSADATVGIIKLSGTFKAAGAAKDERFAINPVGLVSTSQAPEAQEDAQKGQGQGAKGGKAGGAPAAGSMAVPDEEEDDDDGGMIPDEEIIRWVGSTTCTAASHACAAPAVRTVTAA